MFYVGKKLLFYKCAINIRREPIKRHTRKSITNHTKNTLKLIHTSFSTNKQLY